ncbi:MAG: hypothetical protein ACLQVM_16780 [Terriglobia bacterium]
MAFGDIGSPEAVRRAIRECDQMGRDAFLEHYHFKRARAYYLRYGRRLYDSKAIVGVAHRFQFPAKGALRSDFNGGKPVKRKLESLGFKVDVRK